MTFEYQKQKQLSKEDLSKKGSVDAAAAEIVKTLNNHPSYYTTSSCSGRVVLLLVPKSGRKDKSEWLYSTHGKANLKKLHVALMAIRKEKKSKNTVWLKQESAIFHVAAKTIEEAEALMDLTRKSGFKRSGMLTAKNRIVLEILGTENMTVPVAKDGKILVDKKYLSVLVSEANKKMKKNGERLKMFEGLLKEISK